MWRARWRPRATRAAACPRWTRRARACAARCCWSAAARPRCPPRWRAQRTSRGARPRAAIGSGPGSYAAKRRQALLHARPGAVPRPPRSPVRHACRMPSASPGRVSLPPGAPRRQATMPAPHNHAIPLQAQTSSPFLDSSLPLRPLGPGEAMAGRGRALPAPVTVTARPPRARWRQLPGRVPGREELAARLAQLLRALDAGRGALAERGELAAGRAALVQRALCLAAGGRADAQELGAQVGWSRSGVRIRVRLTLSGGFTHWSAWSWWHGGYCFAVVRVE